MLSAAQRQAKLAKKAKAQKARDRAIAADRAAGLYHYREREQREHDHACVVVDLREQLYGHGDEDGGYSPEQIAHVDEIIVAYTPEEYAAAVEAANARRPNPDDLDLE